jgi:hypothetical protein
MAGIKQIADSLRLELNQKLGGEWQGNPLTIFDFFDQGNQSGLRFDSASYDHEIKKMTRQCHVGRMFALTDNDHYRANILALELSEQMIVIIETWALNCALGVEQVANFVSDWAIAPVSGVSNAPPIVPQTPTVTVNPSTYFPAPYAVISLVTFDLIYRL